MRRAFSPHLVCDNREPSALRWAVMQPPLWGLNSASQPSVRAKSFSGIYPEIPIGIRKSDVGENALNAYPDVRPGKLMWSNGCPKAKCAKAKSFTTTGMWRAASLRNLNAYVFTLLPIGGKSGKLIKGKEIFQGFQIPNPPGKPKPMNKQIKLALLSAAFAASLATSHAAIVEVARYHLGETGSVVAPNNFPKDALSTDAFAGTVSNTTAVITPVTNPGSTHALTFGGDTTGYFTVAGDGFFGTNGVADNFGIQLWLNPTSSGNNTFFTTHGDSLGTAFSFGMSGDNWTVSSQGSTITGSAVSLNTWTSLGVIRDGGVTSLYINGALSGTPVTTIAPSFNAGQVHLGVTPGNGSRYFGMMDELNVFTFTVDDNPVNGLILVPEPSTLVMLLCSFGAVALLRRRRKA